jgi:hypothetical protein
MAVLKGLRTIATELLSGKELQLFFQEAQPSSSDNQTEQERHNLDPTDHDLGNGSVPSPPSHQSQTQL